eukprot:8748774-Alexandrium_andersonii.AAC.1
MATSVIHAEAYIPQKRVRIGLIHVRSDLFHHCEGKALPLCSWTPSPSPASCGVLHQFPGETEEGYNQLLVVPALVAKYAPNIGQAKNVLQGAAPANTVLASYGTAHRSTLWHKAYQQPWHAQLVALFLDGEQ